MPRILTRMKKPKIPTKIPIANMTTKMLTEVEETKNEA